MKYDVGKADPLNWSWVINAGYTWLGQIWRKLCIAHKEVRRNLNSNFKCQMKSEESFPTVFVHFLPSRVRDWGQITQSAIRIVTDVTAALTGLPFTDSLIILEDVITGRAANHTVMGYWAPDKHLPSACRHACRLDKDGSCTDNISMIQVLDWVTSYLTSIKGKFA